MDQKVATIIQLPFPGLAPPHDRWMSSAHAESVGAFTDFMRAARGIADDAGTPVDDRIGRLRALEAGLGDGGDGPECARLRDVCARTGVSMDHARHVLQACHKDVSTGRFRSWSELLTYCRYAAAPAGRFLFELHGERERVMACADSLFSAWQVLHIVQGCKEDFETRDRVYLPVMWLRENQVDADALSKGRSSAALRKVFARALESVRGLVETADAQAPSIRDENLREGARASLALADRLSRKLASRDPLTGDVALGSWDRFVVKVRGPGR